MRLYQLMFLINCLSARNFFNKDYIVKITNSHHKLISEDRYLKREFRCFTKSVDSI